MDQHKIYVSDYPSCCGIFILHNFWKHLDPFVDYDDFCLKIGEFRQPVIPTWWNEEYRAERNRDWKCESLETYRSRIRSQLKIFINDRLGRKCYYLATLCKDESRYAHDVLIQEGFEVLVPWQSNPTGTSIQTYIYYLTPKPTEEKKESVFNAQSEETSKAA